MALFQIKHFLLHFLKAGNQHSIHSPFVFTLYNTAIHNKNQFYPFQKIEELRKQLLSNQSTIEVTDFGAGSRKLKSSTRKISDITNTSVKEKEISQTLFKLANYLQPQNIFELGTSLGITTAYLASVNPSIKVTSFEGCPQIGAVARKNLDFLKIRNTEICTGKIEELLAEKLKAAGTAGMVFFDANHRYEPTIQYYRIIKPFLNENSVLIFDDIYWSGEMKRAWDEIRKDLDVSIAIDLYYIGIVFFRKNAPKQYFRLRLH